MKGFVMFLIMVMMLCLVAPMTAMATVDMGASPMLTATMGTWSDVVTAQVRGAPLLGEPRTHEGKFITIDMTTDMMNGTGLIVDVKGTSHLATTDYEISAIMGHAYKAGGGAIFASGKPRWSTVVIT